MSVCAFIITIVVSGHPDFIEMNPILGILFSEFNNYQVIICYALMWSAIFTIYNYINDNMDKYNAEYISYFILCVGFFDLLNNMVSIVKL